MLNELVHDAINRFNTINLKCGTLALELESDSASANTPPQLKKRLEELLGGTEKDLKSARRLLDEIITEVSQGQDSYKESEHFFKVIEPIMSVIEEKKLGLANIIDKNGSFLTGKDLVGLLHVVEEKALACGIILRELRSSLIRSGKYKTETA